MLCPQSCDGYYDHHSELAVPGWIGWLHGPISPQIEGSPDNLAPPTLALAHLKEIEIIIQITDPALIDQQRILRHSSSREQRCNRSVMLVATFGREASARQAICLRFLPLIASFLVFNSTLSRPYRVEVLVPQLLLHPSTLSLQDSSAP